MSVENLGPRVSKTAAADLSAKQYYLVKVTADDTVNLAGAGDCAHGVLQDTPVSGQVCNVQTCYESKVVYGGTVAAGALLASDANGKAVTAATGNYIVGKAIVAGVAGDVGRMSINSAGAKAP